MAGNIDLIGGTGCNVVGAPLANQLTINVTGQGLTWVVTAVDETPMAANTAYIVTINGGQIDMLLPTFGSATIGDSIYIVGQGTGIGGNNGGPWKVTQAANQQIQFSNQNTTVGAAGYAVSQNQYDCIELVYIGNYAGVDTWFGYSSIGNINLV